MNLRCNKANELKQQWNEGNYIPKFETQIGLKHNKLKIHVSEAYRCNKANELE